jgi:dsRNA-specific ribonuclease
MRLESLQKYNNAIISNEVMSRYGFEWTISKGIEVGRQQLCVT